jgi:sphinganine-1-phosphate aldolase
MLKQSAAVAAQALARAAVVKIGPRRLLRLTSHVDRALWLALSTAESGLRRALRPRARAAAGAYLSGASGLTPAARVLNATCSRVAVTDGLPLAAVALVLGVVVGYLWCALQMVLVPRLMRFLTAVPVICRRMVLSSGPVRAKVEVELRKLEEKLAADFATDAGSMSFLRLPEVGVPEAEVERQLQAWAKPEEERWASGKLSGAVYHARDAADRVAAAAFKCFSLSNPMHPHANLTVRRMESEILSMTAELFRCPTSACGALTSGGTESILMAMRAYRQQGRARGIAEPNIVVPETIHAAFDKACDYFCIELRKVPVDLTTRRAVPRAMSRRIDSNTIALACSAVAFPHGTLDPVVEIADMAERRGVGCHVDACLGSLLIPFAAEAGFPVAPFDFGCSEGVTSMSCDGHKYGLTCKGVSCVMFRTRELRSHMFTRAPEWVGGIYATATQAGSRPGALSAGAWAAMVVSGRSQYITQARVVLTAAKRLAEGVSRIDGLTLVGEPALSVVAFTATTESGLNIFNILDAMSAKGWDLNALQHPAALHVCVTLPMAPIVESLVEDLAASTAKLAARRNKGEVVADGSVAALYGMATTVPLEITLDCIDTYLSCVLSPPNARVKPKLA